MAGEDSNFKIERLGAGNYASWATDMEALLTVKGLWKAVEDNETAINSAKAKAVMILNVETYIKPSLKDCANAKAAWDKLKTMHAQQSNAARLQLHGELTSLTKRAEESMAKYVARARQLKDNLVAAGDQINEEQVVLRTLAGLPANYAHHQDSDNSGSRPANTG